jgi:hypothetical protein
VVIEFKRDVYTKALQELSRFLRPTQAGRRYARGASTAPMVEPTVDPTIDLSEPNRP